MNVYELVVKIVLAVVAAAAIVFVVVKYGDRISAWFKKTFGCKCCETVEAPAEEEPAVEETAQEEPVVEETTEEEPVAAESDFEG